MKRKIIGITAVVLAVALLAGILIFAEINNKQLATDNIEDWITQAKEFREQGNNEDAYLRLELYLGEKSDSTDVLMLMANWYKEDGDAAKADEYFAKAAKIADYTDFDLSPTNLVDKFDCPSRGIQLEIKPAIDHTKNMKLSIYSENLAQGEKERGRINYGQKELLQDEKSFTTQWFDVKKGSSLVMSGGFNCSRWQFMDENGEITSIENNLTFHNAENVSLSNNSTSTVSVPYNCIKARVNFYDGSIEKSLSSDGNITVTYGNVAGGFSAVTAQEFELPDLSKNQSITYSDGKWTLNDNGKEKSLELAAIQQTMIVHMGISGTICGTVNVTATKKEIKEGDKTAIYGITYNSSTQNVACRRIDNARCMNFDYKIGSEWVNGTGNDFDKAYPWSDIRLCNIYTTKAGKQNIFYEGSKYFSPEGKWGNVMVEIPKFYTRRVVKNGVESIRISGTKYEGFELEPVFLNSDGTEAERVYMSAYFGSEQNNKIVSLPNRYPTLNLSYGKTIAEAEANGSGYSEMNFAMASALQKLFIIETGTLDASSIIGGDVNKTYYYNGRDTAAITSEKGTNRIILNRNDVTESFTKGTSIILFGGWDSYTNSSVAHREITEVSGTDTTVEIKFDGNSLTVTEKKTVISNIPEKTGKTNSLDYCTAVLEGEDGKVSFRYRYIENLYGSALVMLDNDAYVNNGSFTYIDGTGVEHTINQRVAAQPQELNNRSTANTKMCIKKMSYDVNNPLIMIPTEAGNGASVFSGYCDYWLYANNKDGKNYYLLYGGTQDNGRLAGPFQMRAVINSANYSLPMASARIMYRR